MKTRLMLLISATLFATSLGFGQAQGGPAAPRATSACAGVWRGEMDGLPAVILNITDESGSLSGAMLFYLHERKTVRDSWTSTAGLPEPLFNIRSSGQILQFEISHRRAHPPRTLNDGPVRFRLTVTGPNRAELVREADANEKAGPPLVMVRSNY